MRTHRLPLVRAVLGAAALTSLLGVTPPAAAADDAVSEAPSAIETPTTAPWQTEAPLDEGDDHEGDDHDHDHADPGKVPEINDGEVIDGEYGRIALSAQAVVREIVFPVFERERVSWVDTFGACRGSNCERRHEGQDLMGSRLFHLLSTVDGEVTWIRSDSSGTSGNWLTIRDADGYTYEYGHINNDSPGTDDGSNPARWRFAPGIALGATVTAGQHVAYMGDSGNAEGTSPHVHFEIRRPDRAAVNPAESLRQARFMRSLDGTCRDNSNPPRTPSLLSGAGYWAMTGSGGVFGFGAARTYTVNGSQRPRNGSLGVIGNRRGDGYYKYDGAGNVYAYGAATHYGDLRNDPPVEPISAMTLAPSGRGYWLVTANGLVYEFGQARHYGELTSVPETRVVALLPTATGQGYRLFGRDGSVWIFGDATDLGGPTAELRVAGVAATPRRYGYWILTARGRVYPFGRAEFHGGLRGLGYCDDLAGRSIASSASGNGYWIIDGSGKIHHFGDARPLGDATTEERTTVAMAVMPAADAARAAASAEGIIPAES